MDDEWLPEMISGTGFDPSEIPVDQTSFDDVPEPTTFALVMFSAAPLFLAGRRRNKKARQIG
jgi:hypothetical protein